MEAGQETSVWPAQLGSGEVRGSESSKVWPEEMLVGMNGGAGARGGDAPGDGIPSTTSLHFDASSGKRVGVSEQVGGLDKGGEPSRTVGAAEALDMSPRTRSTCTVKFDEPQVGQIRRDSSESNPPSTTSTETNRRPKLRRTESYTEAHRSYRVLAAEHEKNTGIGRQKLGPFIINPRSVFIRYWDVVIAALLVYTAVVTPFEVSFLKTSVNALFFINRFVDLCFVMDMAFQFRIPFQDAEGRWITDPRAIGFRYVKSWFLLDFVSVLPYDLIGLLSGSSNAGNLKVLRVLRLMRLVKLLRILRAGRMFQRWEATMTINYSKLELVKFVVVLLFISHWLGCAWHMMATIQDECPADDDTCGPQTETWVTYYEFMGMHEDHGALELYITSVYWSVATLSTLGYGDVVPTTDLERAFVSVSAMLGAILYAYMVGSICSIVQGMDREQSAFYGLMDALNGFMEEKQVPYALRVRLRDFFRFKRVQRGPQDFRHIFDKMSPTLRAEVSQHIHHKWVHSVRVFRGCSEAFVVAVAMNLTQETYGGDEVIVKPGQRATCMFIIDKGAVVLSDRGLVFTGSTFGEDMIFRSSGTFIRSFSATTLSNTTLLVLTKDALLTALEDFPSEKKKLRRQVVRMVFRRTIMEYAGAVRRLQDIHAIDGEPTAPRAAPRAPTITRSLFEARNRDIRGVGSLSGKEAAMLDPTLVPVLYLKKKEASDEGKDLNARADFFSIIRATQVIQRSMRNFKAREAAVKRAKRESVVKKNQPRLRALLRRLHLEEELMPIFIREKIGYDSLDRLDAVNMQVMGIAWGDADIILSYHRRLNAISEALPGESSNVATRANAEHMSKRRIDDPKDMAEAGAGDSHSQLRGRRSDGKGM